MVLIVLKFSKTKTYIYDEHIRPSIAILNLISDVLVTVLASVAVDRGFEPRSGQTKDYEIGICCLGQRKLIVSFP